MHLRLTPEIVIPAQAGTQRNKQGCMLTSSPAPLAANAPIPPTDPRLSLASLRRPLCGRAHDPASNSDFRSPAEGNAARCANSAANRSKTPASGLARNGPDDRCEALEQRSAGESGRCGGADSSALWRTVRFNPPMRKTARHETSLAFRIPPFQGGEDTTSAPSLTLRVLRVSARTMPIFVTPDLIRGPPFS